ncbi:hypothetical protein Tco_0988946 [Tanacetum coccineum]|uniref:Integrase, catalytic region, zinc finger, CCHC-type, peptidase aspartic, catalytic n=1 Tax=Tanacetum coccineum TaxID=301880 RepID=A0ABQ5ETR0_9ASTR
MDSIISLGQKNTLAEYMILSSADNRPPMLDKDLYDSWKKYAEFSATKKIQADCDIKATNIILQGLPTDIYSLVNHHRVAKDLWERVQLLMQGTSLTKQERECKLYDAFDKFTHIKGESLHTYYLRFTQLINDMNIYKMKMEQFQVNTKFLNSLPPEWSKFVTDVKLVKDLHTSNFDQLHAYLEQHEVHVNEVRIMRKRNQEPLAFVSNQQMTPPHFNTYQSSYNNPQLQQKVKVVLFANDGRGFYIRFNDALIETEFPAIVFNDSLTLNETLSCEPMVSSLKDEIDFRISFDKQSDDNLCPDDLKSDKGNDDNEIDMIQSSGDLYVPFGIPFDPKRYYKDGDCARMLRRPRILQNIFFFLGFIINLHEYLTKESSVSEGSHYLDPPRALRPQTSSKSSP